MFPREEPALADAGRDDAADGAAREAAADVRPQPLDARLALAHLIEHAVIDFESAITRATRISGVTGARRSPPGRFDLMVECPDPAVGRLCLALAVLSLTGAADARPGAVASAIFWRPRGWPIATRNGSSPRRAWRAPSPGRSSRRTRPCRRCGSSATWRLSP